MILLPLLLLLASCANKVILYPIQKSDIFRITQGTLIGTTPAEKAGWFLSDMYLEEVAKAKVK